MTVKDKHGNVAVTAPYFVRNTAQQEVASRAVDIPTAAGSALALGAITAALGEPTLLGKIMAASFRSLPALPNLQKTLQKRLAQSKKTLQNP